MKRIIALAVAIVAVSPAAASAANRAVAVAPTITINAPVAGEYKLNQKVIVSFYCADAKWCIGSTRNGAALKTSSAGSYTFSVTATNKGRVTLKTVRYTVVKPVIVTPPPPPPTQSCQNGYVALTYDDGPTPMTKQYVDQLVALNAKATFFNVGQDTGWFPEQVLYTASKGMPIQNHTMTHPDLTLLADAEWQAEIRDAQAATLALTGQRETLFRPPYGISNDAISAFAESLGMRQVRWTISPADYDSPSTAFIVNNVLTEAVNQSIVLLHDGYPNTLAAMKPIIDGLRAKGLCPGKIVQSETNPIMIWNESVKINVVAF